MRFVRQLPIVVAALGAVACTAILGTFDVGPGGTTSQNDGGDGANGALSITPADSKMGILRAQTFTATADVTWSLDEGDVAGKIDDKGVYLSGPTPGTYHLTATSKADGSVKAKATVIVVNLGVNVVVGQNGGQGNIDGPALRAHFNRPQAVVGFNDQGDFYFVADTRNNTIRKHDESGVTPKVTTFAGLAGVAGSQDGKGDQARFSRPDGLAVNVSGKRLFVVDGLGTCIRMVDLLTSDVTTLAGRCGAKGNTDGAATVPVTPAEFNTINSIAIAGDNSALFVCDQGRTRRVELGSATARGTAQDVTPGNNPYCSALATDSSNIGYIANGSTVYRFSQVGPFPLTAAQTPSIATAPASIESLAFDNGALYASTRTAIMRMPDPYGASPAFDAVPFAGDLVQSGFVDGPLASSRFGQIGKLAMRYSDVLIPDTDADAIRRIRNNKVETFIGAALAPGNVDGPRPQVKLTGPFAVTTDEAGMVYFGDIVFNDSIGPNNTIRRFDRTTATASRLAGVPTPPGNPLIPPTDGPADQARFWFPIDMTYAKGKLYVVDSFAQAIRTVDTKTGVVATLAGEKTVAGKSDGVGSAAHFQFVLTASSSGGGGFGGAIANDGTNLYVSDTSNYAIRKVVIATGETSTLAGGAVGLLNGTGKAAQFNNPMGLAYDNGFVYVAEWFDHVIRRVDVATGVVDTFMGLPGQAGDKDGDSVVATLNYPFRLAADGLGNLYVAELPLTNEQPAGFVRRIDIKARKISGLAGTPGKAGLQSGPLPSTLGCPTSLSVLPNKDMIFGDFCDLSIGAFEPL